jgi:two-component system response regulator YesN
MDILLADDDRMVLESIGNPLRERGHRLRTAADGAEALRCMEEHLPHLVISDIQMPDMVGLMLLKEARARFPEVPVALMTGDRDLDHAIQALRGGAFDYLKKPIDLREVLACIEKARLRLASAGQR